MSSFVCDPNSVRYQPLLQRLIAELSLIEDKRLSRGLTRYRIPEPKQLTSTHLSAINQINYQPLSFFVEDRGLKPEKIKGKIFQQNLLFLLRNFYDYVANYVNCRRLRLPAKVEGYLLTPMTDEADYLYEMPGSDISPFSDLRLFLAENLEIMQTEYLDYYDVKSSDERMLMFQGQCLGVSLRMKHVPSYGLTIEPELGVVIPSMPTCQPIGLKTSMAETQRRPGFTVCRPALRDWSKQQTGLIEELALMWNLIYEVESEDHYRYRVIFFIDDEGWVETPLDWLYRATQRLLSGQIPTCRLTYPADRRLNGGASHLVKEEQRAQLLAMAHLAYNKLLQLHYIPEAELPRILADDSVEITVASEEQAVNFRQLWWNQMEPVKPPESMDPVQIPEYQVFLRNLPPAQTRILITPEQVGSHRADPFIFDFLGLVGEPAAYSTQLWDKLYPGWAQQIPSMQSIDSDQQLSLILLPFYNGEHWVPMPAFSVNLNGQVFEFNDSLLEVVTSAWKSGRLASPWALALSALGHRSSLRPWRYGSPGTIIGWDSSYSETDIRLMLGS